ncbi:hypothetical protein Bint_4002 (plasmid) [Brachyspira intermedia PWS/A]|uniref:Helix-turn-helix domain-containing protein n=1 Tax=Brachyspira intermedia (strain ATCC 51140 / PWS/A) TaxID=1045858 RepID=G0EQY5_BRAIP|nr:hypothetical protein [Brachyspira intermedia]AEM23507.1 hypothetical protein Bint_4002 [Brachyspira intermedia PWS/A]
MSKNNINVLPFISSQNIKYNFFVVPTFLFDFDISELDKFVYAVIYLYIKSDMKKNKKDISYTFCYASNKQIGELLNKSSSTISKSISKLIKNNLIYTTGSRKDNDDRKIYLNKSYINLECDSLYNKIMSQL